MFQNISIQNILIILTNTTGLGRGREIDKKINGVVRGIQKFKHSLFSLVMVSKDTSRP